LVAQLVSLLPLLLKAEFPCVQTASMLLLLLLMQPGQQHLQQQQDLQPWSHCCCAGD
jgi:hypothetical protein